LNINKILVIQTAFIGDAILATALLEQLHSAFPNAKLYFLVRKGNETLFVNHPFLTEILVWDKQKNKIKNLFKLLFNIRKHKFDIVINCHRFASSGVLAGFSKSKHIAGFKENPFSFLFNYTQRHNVTEGKHEIERNASLINDFCNEPIKNPALYPSQNDYNVVKLYKSENYYCIAPTSVWFTKQVPVNKWIELIDKLESDSIIYLLGAPNDFNICETIISKTNHLNVINLSGKLSLLQSTALMQNAKMNFVNDSAPLHLCSSINANVTAFFLSTSPLFGFTPLSKNSKIIEVKNLTCKPCGLHGFKTCPQHHFKCGNELNMDTIS
jgi:ADP-heptose:LPS heptosyltransferase